MKKFLCLLFALAMVVSLVACSSETSTPSEPKTEEKTAPATKEPATTPASSQTTTNEDPFITEEPSQTEEELPAGPLFESDALVALATQFQGMQPILHVGENARLYVETEDGGLYYYYDEDLSDNYTDGDVAQWSIDEFVGVITVDQNGYYHVGEYLAHDLNGVLLYAFKSFAGNLCTYSVDEEGYVYFNSFEKTGKKVDDNVQIIFEEKEQNGYNFTHLGTYDKLDVDGPLFLMPSKNPYVSSPYVLFSLNGRTYIQQIFNLVVDNKISVITNNALSADASAGLMDYYSYGVTYYKDGVTDKLFYTIANDEDEYELFMPDGHTVDEIVYFNRGTTDMLLFDNGDVYLWEGQASILGETPEKNEELSQVGAEIYDVIYCNGTYYLTMSDDVIYSVD